ncbi:hypothetical protein OL444_13890 [Chitinophaga sp. PC15]|uniref:PRISE-like Rossmann-fold domain-containing protein n=2 Tax=Chitinophaga nivalis TaxID=2991709 RepID=A0ABT3IP73_9BACT|nr:hypothetical protein [Chitinophaga nivalis]MCW3464537.1 hypothetical protein [Chitinophaga nivalis]MCW3485772.1 hypothetical protein [Chitinophaga nivalis]
MNLASIIAVYATLCKTLEVPFRFPGTPEAYHALINVTDATLLAKAMEWAATATNTKNEVFNVTNGDVFRWSQVWPVFARFFDVACEDPQPFSLAAYMADKAPVWKAIIAKHDLQDIPFERLVQWHFGDAIFGVKHDAFFDVNKARRYGFADMQGNSVALMLTTFRQLQENRLIP